MSNLGMAVAQPEERPAETQRPETIAELFAALEAPLLSYALRLAEDMSVAEDMVQEAFLRLHARFEEVREPRRWLYRTVHNLTLNHRRHARKIVPLDPPASNGDASGGEVTDPQPMPDEQMARDERIGLVRLSVEALDARSRELVHLKFDEELSYQEMSIRTGLKTGHIGYLLHHALKTVAGSLARKGMIS